jgi:hypothetical protein
VNDPVIPAKRDDAGPSRRFLAEAGGTPDPRKQARKNQRRTPADGVTAPVLRVYWWAMAILTRSSPWMRWSWLSPPMSICTQLISPVNLLPVGP